MAQRIDTASLELLVQIGGTGSLSAAAKALGLNQPNASRRLSMLERQLGVRLFERGARGSEPTPAGRVAISHASRLLEDLDTLVEEALNAAGAGTARVMASQTISEYLMPEFLAALSANEPGIRMTFEVGNSQEVLQALRRAKIDLGFIEGADIPEDVGITPITTDHLLTVVAPNHPWARVGRVGAEQIARTPLVCREEGSGTREVLTRALAPLDMAAPALEVHSNAAVRTAAISGVAPTVISALAVSSDLEAGRLVSIDLPGVDLSRRLLAVWNPPYPRRYDAALMRLRKRFLRRSDSPAS